MRNFFHTVQLVIALVVYLGITIGSFKAGFEGLSPPELNFVKGIVSLRSCTHIKSTIETFRIEGSKTEYSPELNGSCADYFRMLPVGSKVAFHTTEKGRLWSLSIDGAQIVELKDYSENRELMAPFLLVLGVVFMVFGPLLVWASKRDKKRKHVPSQM